MILNDIFQRKMPNAFSLPFPNHSLKLHTWKINQSITQSLTWHWTLEMGWETPNLWRHPPHLLGIATQSCETKTTLQIHFFTINCRLLHYRLSQMPRQLQHVHHHHKNNTVLLMHMSDEEVREITTKVSTKTGRSMFHFVCVCVLCLKRGLVGVRIGIGGDREIFIITTTQ